MLEMQQYIEILLYCNIFWRNTISSCNIGTSALPDMYAQVPRASALPDMYAQVPRASAYISGNARVPLLQLLCNTSSTLKSA